MTMRWTLKNLRSRCAACCAALALAAATIATATLATPSVARAADGPNADAEAKVAAHIAAGEFGPAKALAQFMGGDQQAAMMAQIAAAQARAGAMGGFANTFRGSGNVKTGVPTPSMNGFMGGQSGYGFVPRGGAAFADFTPLIELIQNTTGRPDPGWEADGGVGRVEQFPQGVLVDAQGMLRKGVARAADVKLKDARNAALASNGNRDVRATSNLRKVSLPRLEREIAIRRAMGQSPDQAMRSLAGIQSIKYVLIYPETGDIVLAGPAGDVARDGEGRLVNSETGRPVLQLDDLVVLLRNATEGDGVFGCSINPRNENMAKAKTFIEQSTKQPLKPGQREGWVNQIRDAVGVQDIVVFGIDPRTRVARTIVEADYRMKLIGMGLEESVLGVTSYLDSVKAGKDGLPPLDVLRWWFTLNYDAVQSTESHDAFELRGQGVKVLSENELLTERGDRIHTGKAEDLNREFAASFTKNFPALAAKYPIYAELKNIFDLALVAAIINSQDLTGQAGWQMSLLGDAQLYPVEMGIAPREVDSIVNHRVIGGKHVVVGVSGGVSVDARGLAQKNKLKTDNYGKLDAELKGSAPKNLAADSWWWD